MSRARDIDEVAPGIFLWQAYAHDVKADLFSTALETSTGIYLVDPIPVDTDSSFSLEARRKMAGIFVTNVNHARAAADFAKTFSVPIYAHGNLSENADFPDVTGVEDGEVLAQGITAVAIDGGPAGEMALHSDHDGGTMVLGDALINFEPRGFGLLPAKYCLDARLMRQSLEKLLEHTFDRMLFAHGTPILSGAHARLQRLLAATR